MMQCKEVNDKLYEYIYEELEVLGKAEVEEHLAHCNECQNEHLSLKKLLIDDMEGISEFAQSIKVPEKLPRNIKQSLKGNSTFNISRYVAAACFLIFMFYAVPVAAYYVVENTALSKYIEFDKGLVKEIEEGRLQVVNKSDIMKYITVRVDGIIRKPDKTTVLFTVKVPKDNNINYAMPSIAYNVITIEDQFGFEYRSTGSAMSLRSANEDGEVTAIMEFEPLKFWSYKLSINITAMDTGTMIVTKDNGNDPRADEKGFIYDMKEAKSVYGNWKIDFYVDRSIKK
jgi:hypothetical protein